MGLPHARGGVSDSTLTLVQQYESSPRPWGCFPNTAKLSGFKFVFPTPVGVFPAFKSSRLSTVRLPHARGGVSSA